jgi:hypothetical protein
MLEHNKNLSSIVGTIQDEGPPVGTSERLTAKTQDVNNTVGSVEAETFVSTWAGRRRSTWRSFFYLLFAALVLAAAFIFIMGGREGYLAESAGPAGAGISVVPAIVGEQDGNFSNQEINERQSLIMKRMEELTAAIAAIKADNDQYRLDNLGELNRQSLITKHMEELTAAIAAIKAGNDQYRLDNQGELKRMQEEFRHELDKIAAAVTGLQGGPGDQKETSIRFAKDSSDINVTQVDSNGAPARGGWVVNVVSSKHIEPVEKLMNKLHKRGIPAEIHEVIIDGKVRYRLRIPGFSTSDEARDYAHNLDGDLGLKGPWVSRR